MTDRDNFISALGAVLADDARAIHAQLQAGAKPETRLSLATAFEASAARVAAMRETEAGRVAEQHTTSPWRSRRSQELA